MAREVRLPKLGRTMEDGTIVGCMVKVGDGIKKGDVIFELETDKATLEIESSADGVVKHILAEVGQTLLVGSPLLILGENGEKVSPDFIESLRVQLSAKPAETNTCQAMKKTANAELTDSAGLVVPIAKAELGATIPVTKLQRLTAEKMLQSKLQIPCFYLTAKVDLTDIVELRSRLNQNSDVKLSYNDFIMRAVAIAMKKFPIMTGRLVGQTIQLADSINVGLAISVPDGLVTPIIKDVYKKDVLQIAVAREALIEKAHKNKLLLADLECGCITVSNLGAHGVESFIPIVVPGQCSILGLGQIIDTCLPDNGDIAVRKLMSLTLSVDHRIANGAYAAQFLDFIRKLLEDTSTFA